MAVGIPSDSNNNYMILQLILLMQDPIIVKSLETEEEGGVKEKEILTNLFLSQVKPAPIAEEKSSVDSAKKEPPKTISRRDILLLAQHSLSKVVHNLFKNVGESAKSLPSSIPQRAEKREVTPQKNSVEAPKKNETQRPLPTQKSVSQETTLKQPAETPKGSVPREKPAAPQTAQTPASKNPMLPKEQVHIPVERTLQVDKQPIPVKESHSPPLILRSAQDIPHIQPKTMPVPFNNIFVSFPMIKNNGITEAGSAEKKKNPEGEKGDEDEEGGGGAESTIQMALVPQGAWIGADSESREIPAFFISIYPITNFHFCQWLTERFKKGALKIRKNGDLVDEEGELICKTQTSNRLSQIQIAANHGKVRFQPLPGSEMHPVVCVTYRGAEQFCSDNGFQLPTEEQWERAAGMNHEKPQKKYRFGCSQDFIDRRWANYSETLYKPHSGNLSTPVGFFNGKTVFPNGEPSKNAASPFGCYDMSGNVYEWVNGWDASKQQRITKGGSYASPLHDLEIAKQHLFFPDIADGFTGFRVALNL